jgi:Domain of unknown function (DUF4136)
MIAIRETVRFLAIGASFAALLAGCATSKPLVRSDYDPDIDFSQYHSFGFFDKLATDERYESLTTQYLKEAVTREMKSRGYTYLERAPDLLINFNIKLKEKQVIRTTPYPAGYYGYRWGYYGAWGGYNYDTYSYEYTEGTMNIDMVDGNRKQMVWEGVAIGRVRQEDFDNVEKAIGNAVSLIFQKFPFTQTRESPGSR